MLAATKEFFALPLDEKMRSYIGLSKCHRGYVPAGEEGLSTGMPEMKEAFDTALDLPADDPDYLAGNPMLGPNVWPDLPGFADAVTAYYHAVLGVGRERRGVAVGDCATVYSMVDSAKPIKGVVSGVGWGVLDDERINVPRSVPYVRPSVNWVRVAHRFPVRIRLEEAPQALVRLGASASVEVRYGAACR